MYVDLMKRLISWCKAPWTSSIPFAPLLGPVHIAPDRLHFVSLHTQRQRPLNGLYRQNQVVPSLAPLENSLNTIENAAADSHSLADFQEGVGGERNFAGNQAAHMVDLAFGNWN